MNKKQKNFIIENYSKLGCKLCCEILNISYNSIYYFAKKNNLRWSKESRSELVKKNSINFREKNPKTLDSYKVNNRDFMENFTTFSCYVLGLLWADGSVYKNEIRIECLENDMRYFKKVLEKTGCWNYYTRQRLNFKQTETALTSNRLLCEFLKENDFLEKSTKSPDKIIALIKKENLIKYFFLGLVDGDGCFYYNDKYKLRQFTITGTINQDWSFVEYILKKINVTFKITRKQNLKSGFSQIRSCGKENLKKIGCYLYDEKDFFSLERKKNKYLECIK